MPVLEVNSKFSNELKRLLEIKLADITIFSVNILSIIGGDIYGGRIMITNSKGQLVW